MIITGFFDTYEKDLKTQIETAKFLNIKSLSIRYFDNQSLKSLDDKQIKDMLRELKKQKLSLDVIDSNYIYEIDQFEEKNWLELIESAHKLGAKTLVAHLPVITEPIDHQQLLTHMKRIIEVTKKKSFQLLFASNTSLKPGHIAYLINQIKGIKFIFDAGLIKTQKASVTTTYRIMKKNTLGLNIYDLERNGQPALLGFGYTQVMDVIKKMRRDKFKGYLFIDFNLMTYLENRDVPVSKKGFFGFLSKKKKQTEIYQKMDELLQIPNDKKISYNELLLILKSIIEKIAYKKK